MKLEAHIETLIFTIMTELQLIKRAIDRLQVADEMLMQYNPNWSTDEEYRRALNMISVSYHCLMELEKIKVSIIKPSDENQN